MTTAASCCHFLCTLFSAARLTSPRGAAGSNRKHCHQTHYLKLLGRPQWQVWFPERGTQSNDLHFISKYFLSWRNSDFANVLMMLPFPAIFLNLKTVLKYKYGKYLLHHTQWFIFHGEKSRGAHSKGRKTHEKSECHGKEIFNSIHRCSDNLKESEVKRDDLLFTFRFMRYIWRRTSQREIDAEDVTKMRKIRVFW